MAVGRASHRRRSARLAVGVLLVACTLGAQLPGAAHDALWQDEIGTERVISQPTVGGALHAIVDGESTPPAFFLLARGADRAATGLRPDSRARAIRALSLLFSLGCTVLTFVLAYELMPLWGAALAGLLVSFGSLVVYGSLLRAYALLAFACVAFAFLLERAAARPGLLRLALLSAAVGLGSLTHYFFLFTLGAGVLWLFLSGLRGTALARVGAALGVGLIPLAAWSPYWLRQYRHGIYATAPPFDFAHFVGLLPSFFAPDAIVSNAGLGASAVVTLAVLVPAALLLRRSEGRLCGLFVLAPFLIVSVLVWVTGERVFRDRNLIGVAPFAAIALAWGCASLPWRRVSYGAGFLVGAVVIGGFAYGEIDLGRTPYDRIAREMIRQGFRRDEPIFWFGSWGGHVPMGWYVTMDEPANMWPRLSVFRPSKGACSELEVVARTQTSRLWLERHRDAIVAETSLPSYGDVPQGRRNPDLIVARLRWSAGILTPLEVVDPDLDRWPTAPINGFLFRVAGSPSSCLRS
jgi:hypothetical protein